MRLLLRIATCVTLLLAAVSGQSKTDVFLTSTTKTDAPATPAGQRPASGGNRQGDGVVPRRGAPGGAALHEVDTSADAGVLVEHQRQRELLGSGDENALAQIAEAIGADYLVHVDVKQSQGQATVTLSTKNVRTGEMSGRDRRPSESTTTPWARSSSSRRSMRRGWPRSCGPARPSIGISDRNSSEWRHSGSEPGTPRRASRPMPRPSSEM